jgi:hypothetical protein
MCKMHVIFFLQLEAARWSSPRRLIPAVMHVAVLWRGDKATPLTRPSPSSSSSLVSLPPSAFPSRELAVASRRHLTPPRARPRCPGAPPSLPRPPRMQNRAVAPGVAVAVVFFVADARARRRPICHPPATPAPAGLAGVLRVSRAISPPFSISSEPLLHHRWLADRQAVCACGHGPDCPARPTWPGPRLADVASEMASDP